MQLDKGTYNSYEINCARFFLTIKNLHFKLKTTVYTVKIAPFNIVVQHLLSIIGSE